MIFPAASAKRAFEDATGAQLALHREGVIFKVFRLRHPVGQTLPGLDVFEGSESDTARFGGRFCVRVWHEDRADRGVQSEGLEVTMIERGPQAGGLSLSGSASRANVEVMFWPNGAAVTPEVEAAWRELTAFLHRL